MATNNKAPAAPKSGSTTEKIRCVVLGAADAGKTSLLRRYFRETFSHVRVPTAGSDFYTKRVTVTFAASAARENQDPQQDQEQVPVLFQMFDTPGKDPTVRRRRQDDHEQLLMQSLLDAYWGRVDAVMLVFDMTSSTSFTQLRAWYALWRKRLLADYSNNAASPSMGDIPILIVGNKRDLIPSLLVASSSNHQQQNGNHNHNDTQQQHAAIPVVPQRDVMGVHGTFKGKDFRYEYRVDHTPTPTATATTSSTTLAASPRTSLHHFNNSSESININSSMCSTNSSAGIIRRQSSQQQQQQQQQRRDSYASNNHHYHHHHHHTKKQQPPQHRYEISTFASTAGTGAWTQDDSYLDSLLGTEDRSNPDRDMVQLWCLRNGLPLVECSAALDSGGNVDTAMTTLLQLVLEQRRLQQQQQQQQQQLLRQSTRGSDDNNNDKENMLLSTTQKDNYMVLPNQELDLLERYRPKHYKCCFGVCPAFFLQPWANNNNNKNLFTATSTAL